jgi:hypothetical protein
VPHCGIAPKGCKSRLGRSNVGRHSWVHGGGGLAPAQNRIAQYHFDSRGIPRLTHRLTRRTAACGAAWCGRAELRSFP